VEQRRASHWLLDLRNIDPNFRNNGKISDINT
jgi:hypothetical protein